jgi:16S rRNA (uracil1498-N3)-methyltransferase
VQVSVLYSPRVSRPPAFFLADGRTDELLPEEAEHALKVLRLAPGDLVTGLDGCGGRHPLRVRALSKRALTLEPAGEPEFEPAPGAEGAPLPWFELAVSWPKRNRVEDMVNRLTQLGMAAVRPLVCEHRGPEEVPEEVPARVQRVAREAVKQSGRAWLPRFQAATPATELLKHVEVPRLAVLDPSGALSLDSWLHSLQPSPAGYGTESRPIVFAVGPEGGFSEAELGAWRDAGVGVVRLGPFVLRIETAAEAAMAAAGMLFGRR